MDDIDKNKTRSLDFLNNLYEEKIKHKEHRHEFVKNKLLFTIGLFSIGSLKIIGVDFNLNLSILLYFIPFVALAFDVYIFSEDFKVKRIGVFILNHCNIKCVDEKDWEKWLTESKNRENLANIASLLLTIIALIASFALLLMLNTNSFSFCSNLFFWFAGCLLLIIIVFTYSFFRRNKLLKDNKKSDDNNISLTSLK